MVPDLLVERVDEEYVVLLNDRHVPRLRISSAYEGVLRDKKKSECTAGEAKTREFIQGKLNSAKWLIQTIEQRRRTMIKVMNCIIREQREFFDKGIAFLRPLTLQQVARQIIARTTGEPRSQRRQTPRGGASAFFSSGLETEDGRCLGPDRERHHQTPIDEEDKKSPYSDDAIAKILHDRGLAIARRTASTASSQHLPARSGAESPD